MADDSLKWHLRFLDLAYLVGTWSKDPSTKVGAVIVDPNRRILGLGYNGFPRGVTDAPERYADRQGFKYPAVVHAEVNAILNSAHDLRGATLYCSTGLPCPDCTGVIIQAGIGRVVYPPSRMTGKAEGRVDWDDRATLSETMFAEARPVPVLTQMVEWTP